MNGRACCIALVLILNLFFIVVITTSLVVSGKYWLEPLKADTVETTCYVSDCACFPKTCKTTHSYTCGDTTCYYYSYYTCYDCVYTYSTYVDGKRLTDTDTSSSRSSGSYCADYPDGTEITCYYLKSSPDDSLTQTSSNNYGGAIAYIVIFTVVDAILVGLQLWIVFMLFAECDTSYSYTYDPSQDYRRYKRNSESHHTPAPIPAPVPVVNNEPYYPQKPPQPSVNEHHEAEFIENKEEFVSTFEVEEQSDKISESSHYNSRKHIVKIHCFTVPEKRGSRHLYPLQNLCK